MRRYAGEGLNTKQLNIVLVEPQIPQNTGNIARTCAATGARLHLVGPLGFQIDDKKLKRAGLDYWHLLDITCYEGWQHFWEQNRQYQEQFFYFTTKGRSLYSGEHYPGLEQVYLLFGREDKGLPEELLYAHPERCVRLPMIEGARSLNLSNTVAIGAYEVLRQWEFPTLQRKGSLTKFNWEDA